MTVFAHRMSLLLRWLDARRHLPVWAIFYLASLSLYPSAGYPTTWLFAHLATPSIEPGVYPLTGWLVRTLANLSPAGLAVGAALLNLVAALLVLALLARVVERIPLFAHTDTARSAIAGLGARLALAYLALAPGFWWAATRAGPDMCGLLMLVFTVYGIQKGLSGSNSGYLPAAAFMAGLGFVESPFMTLAAPVLMLWLLAGMVSLAVPSRFIARTMLTGAAGVASGAILLIALWARLQHGWSWFPDLAAAWHAERMMRLFPPGWLALSAVAGAMLFIAWRGAIRPVRRPHRFTRWIPHVLMAVLLLVHVADPLSGASAASDTPNAVVVWVIAAITFAGLGVMLLRPWLVRRPDDATGLRVMVLAVALVAGLLRLPGLNARASDAVQPVWEAFWEDLDNNDWVVTDGAFDAPLWLAAIQQGRNPVFIHPAFDHRATYRHHLAARMTDPRYQSLAGVGVGPLMAERLQQRPPDGRGLVACGGYQPLVLAGFEPLPLLLRYEPHAPGEPLDLEVRLNTHRAFWRAHNERLLRTAVRNDDAGRTAAAVVRALSRSANDLGVYLEHHGRPDLAREAYAEALRLRPDNLSARLNTAAGAHRDDLPTSLSRAITARCAPDLLSALAREEGLIFDPHVRQWIAEWCAWQSAASPHDPRLANVLHLRLTGRTNEALTAVQALTRASDAPDAAWMLLGVIGSELGDDAAVDAAFTRMEERGADWAPLLVVLGERALKRGDVSQAVRFLEDAHRRWPLNRLTLERLIQLHLHRNDEAALDRHLRWLLSIDPWNPWANFALGLRHARAHQHEPAEAALLAAISRQPLPLAYNNLAWLQLSQDRTREALHHVRRAIALEPYGPAQWDTLASVLIELEAWDAAAIALETALQLDPDSAASAVHYAAFRHRSGRTLPAGEQRLERFTTTDIPADPRLQRLWPEEP